MLVHLPQQTSAARPSEERRSSVRPSFETALSRDLASRRVIAYEPVAGGAVKRLGDLFFVGLSAPFWALALLFSIVFIKANRPSGHCALTWDECVGYGGRRFMRGRLNWKLPSAEIVPLHPQTQDAALEPEQAPITWADVIERLPEMISVLRGDMSLVGPRPLSYSAFAASPRGLRYYASARPGFFSVSDCGPTDDPEALLFKYYVKQWSPSLDRRIIIVALKRFQLVDRAREQKLPPEAE